MTIVRISKTKKILNLLDAIISDIGASNPFVSYAEARKRLHSQYEGKFSEALSNLKRCGYLEIVEIKNTKSLRLTIKGKLKALLPLSRKKKEWDGRWRLVAFDIEEKRRGVRGRFREALRMLGFLPLQKSLWITPYDVSEKVEEVIDWLRIDANVDYFISQAITNEDKLLKEKFNL